MANSTDNKAISENIEAIYTDYVEKLRNLEQEQSGIIKNFIAQIEADKIEQIKKQMNQ